MLLAWVPDGVKFGGDKNYINVYSMYMKDSSKTQENCTLYLPSLEITDLFQWPTSNFHFYIYLSYKSICIKAFKFEKESLS